MNVDRNFLVPLFAAVLLTGGAARESLSAVEAEPSAAEGVEADAESTPPPSAAKLEGLVAVLGSEDYQTRMGAQSELLALASRHAAVVAEALVGPYLVAKDPDLRARLRLALWNAKRFEVNERPVGFVGIQMQDSFRQVGNQANAGFQRTVQVVRVIEGTAAAKNDLRIGDQIVGVDGKDFNNGESPSILFKEHISSRTVGEPVNLKIVRGPQELTVKVELGERPMDLLGLGGDERDLLDAAFGAFLRESALKRGLAVPGNRSGNSSPDAGEGGGPDVDPFAP
jgi:membrane-associated protease RseP (regulator of RpoE activity)